MFSFITPRFLMAFAAGVVVGALGYKLCSDKNFNPQAVQKTVTALAEKLKSSRGKGGRNGGPGGESRGGPDADGEFRGGHGGPGGAGGPDSAGGPGNGFRRGPANN